MLLVNSAFLNFLAYPFDVLSVVGIRWLDSCGTILVVGGIYISLTLSPECTCHGGQTSTPCSPQKAGVGLLVFSRTAKCPAQQKKENGCWLGKKEKGCYAYRASFSLVAPLTNTFRIWTISAVTRKKRDSSN